MATKKKTRKKLARSKKTAGGKVKPTKKQTKNAPKKSTKKASSPSKPARKKSVKSATKGKTSSASSQKTRGRGRGLSAPTSPREMPDPGAAGQSGDLQGLSDVESADSESVDELIEEGNAFEAGVVAGVEDADDDGPREVHTHEVPEDDVPEEYLDED